MASKKAQRNNSIADGLIEAARTLCGQVAQLEFGPPITHVYHPLEYAWKAHAACLQKYGNTHGAWG
ncbi:MAG: hypothetical protein FJ403_16230 [Verrucomicrobia bacterium]|nr:hypothetical protein [Verrucomicrobiota bacterium]